MSTDLLVVGLLVLLATGALAWLMAVVLALAGLYRAVLALWLAVRARAVVARRV
ncbi:hypothetical protein OG264_15945 [Streptomyces xanthophaeus]|uniref:hypothetical protein n=1 Tax=Streptomyces xanthophaeus TaxID=67385 RepID=UPI00386D4071|nr:hypothetical protein OG264_15945 [Streptomyces xanthophaeus]WST62174.1 hypothetical protein OG605_22490 [Streptomyces xanthophaeus]